MSSSSFSRGREQVRALTRKDKKAEYDYMRVIEKVGGQPGYYNPNMAAIRRALKESTIRRVLGPRADYFELTDAGRKIFDNIKRIKAQRSLRSSIDVVAQFRLAPHRFNARHAARTYLSTPSTTAVGTPAASFALASPTRLRRKPLAGGGNASLLTSNGFLNSSYGAA